jgi:hypothetical protein
MPRPTWLSTTTTLLTTNHVIAETITLTRTVGHTDAARLGDQLYNEKLARIHWASPRRRASGFRVLQKGTRIRPSAPWIA